MPSFLSKPARAGLLALSLLSGQRQKSVPNTQTEVAEKREFARIAGGVGSPAFDSFKGIPKMLSFDECGAKATPCTENQCFQDKFIQALSPVEIRWALSFESEIFVAFVRAFVARGTLGAVGDPERKASAYRKDQASLRTCVRIQSLMIGTIMRSWSSFESNSSNRIRPDPTSACVGIFYASLYLWEKPVSGAGTQPQDGYFDRFNYAASVLTPEYEKIQNMMRFATPDNPFYLVVDLQTGGISYGSDMAHLIAS